MRGAWVRRLIGLLLVMIMGITACGGDTGGEVTPEPLALLTEAAENIRERDTFRLHVEQGGARYNFPIMQGNDAINVQFRFARAQYVKPNILQATARVIAAGLPIDIDIFSLGALQWYRLPGVSWVRGEFAPGFDPMTLIAADSGFQAALTALIDLEFIGTTSLEDGTPAYHLKGIANGPSITALVVGLIEAADTVPVDVYIHRETHYPVRLVLTQPETVTEAEPDPTTWTIDVYDLDADAELAPPDDVELPAEVDAAIDDDASAEG